MLSHVMPIPSTSWQLGTYLEYYGPSQDYTSFSNHCGTKTGFHGLCGNSHKRYQSFSRGSIEVGLWFRHGILVTVGFYASG
jgi:hypothetical protein